MKVKPTFTNFVKKVTSQDMHNINMILDDATHKKKYAIKWSITFDNDVYYKFRPLGKDYLTKSDNFIKFLFRSYETEKLTTFKKIFDYAYANNIDLFSIFHEDFFIKENKTFMKYSGYLDLVSYAAKKNYIHKNINLSDYFVDFDKVTKENVNKKIKLFQYLDDSETSFNIYCHVFNDYFKVNLKPSDEILKNVQTLFKKFQHQNFFITRENEHLIFYESLSLLNESVLYQQDSFFTKRLCFSAENKIPKLQKNIANNLQYIYGSLCDFLKEQNIISDSNHLLEEKTFYLYIMSNDLQKTENIAKSLTLFHEKIKSKMCLLESQEFYEKLFTSVSLESKLNAKYSLSKEKSPLRKI